MTRAFRTAHAPCAARRPPLRRLFAVEPLPQPTAGACGALETRRDLSDADAYALAECLAGPPEPVTFAARRGE